MARQICCPVQGCVDLGPDLLGICRTLLVWANPGLNLSEGATINNKQQATTSDEQDTTSNASVKPHPQAAAGALPKPQATHPCKPDTINVPPDLTLPPIPTFENHLMIVVRLFHRVEQEAPGATGSDQPSNDVTLNCRQISCSLQVTKTCPPADICTHDNNRAIFDLEIQSGFWKLPFSFQNELLSFQNELFKFPKRAFVVSKTSFLGF